MVLAVYNGEHLIQKKIENLLSLGPNLIREIILVSDGSTDKTVDICRRMTSDRLQLIELKERCGKASAVAAGIRAASSELLVFNDLRAWLRPDALERLLENFADPSIGCAGGELHLTLEDVDGTVSAVGGLYWRYERWLRSCESRFDSSAGLSGCFFAARKSLVTLPPDGLLLDDVFQPLEIIRKGYRAVVDPRAVATDTLPATKTGEFNRKVRTLAGNYQLLAAAPWMLTGTNRIWWQFFSHKVLRLFVPFLLVGMLLSSVSLAATLPMFLPIAALQILGWSLFAVNVSTPIALVNRVTSAGNAWLILNLAAVAGLYKFLFHQGPLWKMWSKDVTARVP